MSKAMEFSAAHTHMRTHADLLYDKKSPSMHKVHRESGWCGAEKKKKMLS